MNDALERPIRFRLMLTMIVAAGVALRLRQYFFNRSLWFDETLITLNILRRSARALLGSLDDHQVAPPGFLLLEKTAVTIFGTSELALRLVPLLAGLIALFLFVRVLRLVVSPRASLIALALFAIAAPQIDYSTEVKQYAVDVAVGLALMWAVLSIHRADPPPTRWLLLAMMGAASVWFSHPAVFVLAGVGVVLAVDAVLRRDRARLGILIGVGGVWAVSWLACYFSILRATQQDTFLSGMWDSAYMPRPLWGYWTVTWVMDNVFGLFSYPVGLPMSGLGLFACLVALTSGNTTADRTRMALLLSPVVFAFIAAALRLYPFQGRFLLFAVPSLLALVAAGADQLLRAASAQLRTAGALVVVLLLIQPLWTGLYSLRHPHAKEETRPVLDYLVAHRRPDDAIYLYWRSHPALDYYVIRHPAAATLADAASPKRAWSSPSGSTAGFLDRFEVLNAAERTAQFSRDVEALRGKGRTWLLFHHVSHPDGLDEEQWFLRTLDQFGPRLDQFAQPGAALYLYDLHRTTASPN